MRNKDFSVGDHITVYGFKGIVEKILNCKEYKVDRLCRDTMVISDEEAKELENKGYTLVETGRTATYFTISFDTDEGLKNTSYNHGSYGCLDEFENYGTW